MRLVLEEVRNGGFVGLVLLFFGLLSVALAVAAIASLIARNRVAALVGVASLCLGALLALGGMAGTLLGRSHIDDAISGESISPVFRERLRRQGYAEARSAARIGLVFAAPVILAGAAAMLLAARRKQEPMLDITGDEPLSSRWSVTPSQAGGGSLALPALLVFGGLSLAGGAAPLLQPLPGRDIAYDDPTWELLAATDDVMRGRSDPGAEASATLEERCDQLEEAMRAATTRSAGLRPGSEGGPDHEEASGRCVDHRLERVLEGAPDDRRRALRALAASPLLLDPARRQRVEGELGKVVEPAPAADAPWPDAPAADAAGRSLLAESLPAAAVRHGAATVSGRIPPDAIRRVVQGHTGLMRLCYEAALQRDPALSGQVVLRFVIGRNGAVAAVSDGGSDIADSRVVDCVTRVVQSMSFPRPEEGIVSVTYPFVFRPG